MSPPAWFRQFIQQVALCAQGHKGCRQSIMALHFGSCARHERKHSQELDRQFRRGPKTILNVFGRRTKRFLRPRMQRCEAKEEGGASVGWCRSWPNPVWWKRRPHTRVGGHVPGPHTGPAQYGPAGGGQGRHIERHHGGRESRRRGSVAEAQGIARSTPCTTRLTCAENQRSE